MGIGEALIIAVSGFMVVFLMLVLLWFIIVCINKVVTTVEEKEKATEVPVIEDVKTPEPVKQNETYGGEIALYDVDEKTAACIMAIISDTTKIPLNQLIFKSIKALD
ncbi:MAG: OadG family protein [Solobacterium sp.]|nr:OadG family protein [Solobacterium sp.]